jgi:DNA-binding SARP family transcriptional activator
VAAAEWQNQKRVREFFFCLLAHPDGLTKEAIGLIFWPDSLLAQLKLQFKNTIYRLRFALGPDVILFDEDRYWFNRVLDYEYDVESMGKHLERGRSLVRAEEKIAAFQAAARLYKGPFLPEISGTWAEPERERLRQGYVEAMLALARLHLERGDASTTLAHCQKLLQDDGCLEDAHRLAMRAYAALGNRAAVTRQFERCRQALLEEIDAPPSPQTEQLYETLKQ